MDWLTERPAYIRLGPQLMAVKVLEICAGILLLLALLTVTIGWPQHLSRRLWLLACVPLVVGIAAGMTAHALHDTYRYWVDVVGSIRQRIPAPVQDRVEHGVNNANQRAAVLAWVFVLVTSTLVALGLLGWWQLVVSRRQRQVSTSIALNS